MDPNENGKKEVSSLKELDRRRQSPDNGPDSIDLDFIYDDADTYANEIAELYGYAEQTEFQNNLKAFEEQMDMYNMKPCWQKLSDSRKKSIVTRLLDQLEVSNKVLRMQAARCFLYLAQGCWAEMHSDKEQEACTKDNVFLIHDYGVFHAFVELLNIETDNSSSDSSGMRNVVVSAADSSDLRVILSFLYIVVEVTRNIGDDEAEHWKNARDTFKNDLSDPVGGELIVVKFFRMVTRFCSCSGPHFPMKKVLLLLWKIILVSLGGMSVLRELKNKYRMEHSLPPVEEDAIEITRTLRSSSPSDSMADIIENQSQKRNRLRRRLRRQSPLDEVSGIDFEQTDDEIREFEEINPVDEMNEILQPSSSHPMSPKPVKILPWNPKVRQKDLDEFLEKTRVKYVGFPLKGDRESLYGLPQPIHESVTVLKRHLYTSLAEIQIQQEDQLTKTPISSAETKVPLTPTESLYQAMLPNLPQYMIALLKILLAAASASKAKTDSKNIMAEVLPEEIEITILKSIRLETDVYRHKEIIVKAVSAILLLLLKHLKINHVYQFEFMSQQLVFAKFISLVLNFFKRNVMEYIEAKNFIPLLDFPACVIGDKPELTRENLEIGVDNQKYSWRNIFSCINLLRVLNKLTKWKNSRIMTLVVFKSAPILKRTLKVRHAMMQLYVLKLLKMQTKYLGRQWRKSNMKIMSAIYQKVRHHLNDDWAYGNDTSSRPWDFQDDEVALRDSVDRYNSRRYSDKNIEPVDFQPVDTRVVSVLGGGIELTEEFKGNYDVWLQKEVLQSSINWDEVLNYGYL